jgi:glucokinase
MKNKLYLTIDIGGTKILLALFDDREKIVYREKFSTPDDPVPENIADRVLKLLEDAENQIKYKVLENIEAAGICFAGFVEHRMGLVHQAPNLGWDKPVALKALFEDKLLVPVIVENDANAAVVGEVFYGAARGYRDVIYTTISTGIGGGLFLDGRLYRGSSGFAGEIGHTKLFGAGRKCNCGGDDCLEAWASGNGIARNANQIWEPVDLKVEQINTALVFKEAEAGNITAQRIVKQAIEKISLGLSNLFTLLNPECLVVGGGMAAANPHLLTIIEEGIILNAIRPAVDITTAKIVAAELGAESGIWGIYALIINKNES